MDMTPETKFRGLEAAAMTRLSRPLEGSEPIAVHRASVLVLIWRYPSFEPYQSWALIQARGANADEWFVRRTTWERSIDYGRAADPLKQAALLVDADPRPTLEVLDATVDSDFATKFLGRLGELTIPKLLMPEGIGIDGVVNGLETHLGQVHLEWWCNGPTAWQSLTEEVERLRLDLEAVLAHPTRK